jgi:hypothetical protein
MPTLIHRRNVWILGLLAMGAAVGVAASPVITQDPAYHQFADTRVALGVPHGWNVLSNAPFLLAGLLGLWRCRWVPAPARPAWLVAFSGVALVAVGSAWYHHAPSGDALVWDRLPMTIGFMGVLTAVLAPVIGASGARALLAPAVAVGVASVGYWHWTGDLRPYVWVQFAPLLLIAAVIAFDRRSPSTRSLLVALALYGLAKGLEAADGLIFTATAGVVAGHPLKHLAASAACLALIRVAARSGRTPVVDRQIDHCSAKLTVTVMIAGTAVPLRRAGSYRHSPMAASAETSRSELTRRMTTASTTQPVVVISDSAMTTP